MIICENGICRDMTEEEIREYEASLAEANTETMPTLEERVSAMEAAMLEEVLNNG